MHKRILISGRIPRVALEILSRENIVTMLDELSLLTKSEFWEEISDKDALLCLLSDNIDADIIKAGQELKIIANYGAGFNNIDISTAGNRGIYVTNTPQVSTAATADLTWGLIIAIARRIAEGDKNTRAGKFTGWAPLYHLGTEVTGKTLGIIGMGNIGQAVAKRAQGFDMKVIYYNRTRLKPQEEKALGVTYADKKEVIKQADFLSLHVSYHPELKHMIAAQELSLMKPSAFLINAARGSLVDEAALFAALQRETITGAALDVYEFEPRITKGLAELNNTILCPHLGNATIEARTAMAQIAANNILAVLKGQEPDNCVNKDYFKKG